VDDEVEISVAEVRGSTRERLMRATAEVFGERGYDGATVTDIARRAGLTTGAIYANFRDKAELLLEAIAAIEAAQDANLFRIRGREEDLARARELFMQDVAGWVARDRRDDRALVLEARVACRRDPAVRERLRAMEARRLRTVVELIESLEAIGVISHELDPETLALFLLSVPLGLGVLEATGLALPEGENWRALMERLVRTFLLTSTGRKIVGAREVTREAPG
jgi:AcrR family transcriptional regulator